MFKSRSAYLPFILGAALCSGCSSSDNTSTIVDSDSGPTDSAALDSGNDASHMDASPSDSSHDSASADSSHDSSTTDSSADDAATIDSGNDTAVADTGSAADTSTAQDSSLPPADASPPSPKCSSTASAGDYCGNDKIDNGIANTLYTCPGPNAAPTKSVACSSGCHVAPSGQDDYCNTPTTTPKCSASASAGDYCGNDKIDNGIANTLYTCPGPSAAPTKSLACSAGCHVAPDGFDDFCNAPTTSPKCSSTATAGKYCGDDKIDNGDSNVLYTCPGPSAAPTNAVTCSAGCVTAPSGQDDYCKTSTTNGYKLPWSPGVSMSLTQDCNDSCCNDHVGTDEYAWDWANGSSFIVRAARAGTITHLKLSSDSGGASSSYSHYVNMIVIDHGDGTQATYMHLKHASAQAGITCGAKVTQGQALASAGTTGHSTGIHLHFHVAKVHPGVATCECGSNGLSCAADYNPFPNVWVSSTYPSVPISFSEWPTASQCSNRRITMPASQN
jgi:hypothetical protein